MTAVPDAITLLALYRAASPFHRRLLLTVARAMARRRRLRLRTPLLARHFAATEWARGGWGDALAHLPGARRGAAPLRVHPGENTRVVLIPYRLVREAAATA